MSDIVISYYEYGGAWHRYCSGIARVPEQRRTAKIHDFCLGIPFGGFVLSGGISGFIFSRSPATLSNRVLFEVALLFLSTISLKVWRQKSSLSFILGQAALSVSGRTFKPTHGQRKLLRIISSAMLCFYLYVLVWRKSTT
ncbi:hypothetical protein L6164_034160 [Bauhinia variegata]|uniref:Uncharacterized protein n=1 Tax=Bauhinia variegata TaxID=167791 RepID=A0ACB9KUR3_BAUVA|nr:hypothetical protein L6164_034160 [Bauhinia variegata]